MVAGFPLRIGVVADTHVPDRVDGLHPNLLKELRTRQVDLILHAGDISAPEVLTELEQVAPVKAAFGNRDWAFKDHLPWVHRLEIGGTAFALMHGHGSWWHYFWDKWIYVAQGYQLKRYQKLVVKAAPEAHVIVFGHTHHAENVWVGGQLLFNPGSASRGFRRSDLPSYGILELSEPGQIRGEIIQLQGYRAEAGRWLKVS